MTRMVALVALIGCLMMNLPSTAAEQTDLARENAELRQRVDRLEQQMEQLKTQDESTASAPPAAPAEQKKSTIRMKAKMSRGSVVPVGPAGVAAGSATSPGA
jgi:cell division protein FtsB